MDENPVQLHIDFQQLQVDDDDNYGGLSDGSIEFQLLECSPEQPASLNMERRIINYLKELGLKMKTDPRSKQDKYYKQKRTLKRAQTWLEQDREIKSTTMTPPQLGKKPRMQLQLNTIIGRRTPQNVGSTPLIQFPSKEKGPEKSKFCVQREPSNSPL